jgi:catechol 2,3-dioxygenase
MTIHVERVGHVVLNVRDLDRAVSFYGGVLGLREVGRLRGNMAFFSATGTNHHDIAVQAMGPDAPLPRDNTVGLAHVAFKIGDSLDRLRAARAHLEAAGVAIEDVQDHVVSQSIYFRDPDRNLLELYVDADPRIWRENPAAVATALPFEL